MATKTRTYWENDNGAIYCEAHLGSYMTAAILTNPKAIIHHTPLGSYYKMMIHKVKDFEALMAELGKRPECCETCRG